MSNIHYEPPATIANFMASEKFYNFIIGPVGCLAGRSLVVTEYGAVPTYC